MRRLPVSHTPSPPDRSAGDITLLLRRMEAGDARAANDVISLVYQELRRLAAAKMAREPSGRTLQPTALVHEAWLRLGGDQQPDWENRRHFFGAASEAMRRILIERARHRRAERHGGGLQRTELDESALATGNSDEQVLAVHEALEKLSALDAAKAELVKLRYFVGLSVEEAAAVLKISVPTAVRWWAFARVWLFEEIEESRRQG
jgi:RNA polymerase sigma factor (TIGR02999 family)